MSSVAVAKADSKVPPNEAEIGGQINAAMHCAQTVWRPLTKQRFKGKIKKR